MTKSLLVTSDQTANIKLVPHPKNRNLNFPTGILNLSAALMSVGLLMAAPAFAQTPAAKEQKTQEGGGPSMPGPTGGAFNAKPGYKQPTQEGGGPSMPGPTGGAFNAKPGYKQPAQEGGGPSMPGPTDGAFNADPGYKQKTQEGGGPSMPGPTGGAFNANPDQTAYKQKTQSLSPSVNEDAGDKK
jgi:hypothetical protein